MRGVSTRIVLALWTLTMVAASVIWFVLQATIDPMAGVMFGANCALIVGAILTARVPGNAVGPLALAAGSAWVLYLFGSAYGLASLKASSSLPGAYFFSWLGAWTGGLLPLGITALILVFPTGRPYGWWRVFLLAPIAGALSALIGGLLLWGQPMSTLTDQEVISQIEGYGFVDAGFIVGFAFAIPATISVIARYRMAGEIERHQIKWLLAATSLFALSYISGAVTDDSNELSWWLVSFALAAIPISILFAVLRYRLYEIDRILSRTVSYVIVLGVLTGVYLAGLSVLSSLFSESSLSVAASTLAAAALFTPVRRRVQAWVERRFNRSRYDAEQVVDRFSGSLRQNLGPNTLVRGWVDVVSETMQPSSVAVWIRNDFGTREG
jgi:MFS family permease